MARAAQPGGGGRPETQGLRAEAGQYPTRLGSLHWGGQLVAGQGQLPSVKSEKLAGPLRFPVHMHVGTRVSVCSRYSHVRACVGLCWCM